MKELSMEQKAKAYDEALERVKKLLSRCRNNRDRITMVYRVNDIESIFPELKKSEDEKIRMSLIELFKDMEWDDSILHDYNMDKDKTIAWLEKQGKKTSWKPTEEQMDALETAVSSLQSNTLERLYQDLKREKNYE